MQTQLLAKDPTPQLRVYAIWLPMLWSDERSMWNGTNMVDNRVIHYWDGDRSVGRWFAEHIEGYEGIVWDAYYLYGPDAVWDSTPLPMADTGGTIYSDRNTLETQIQMLLEK